MNDASMAKRTKEELADALEEDWHMCADDRCRTDRLEAAARLRAQDKPGFPPEKVVKALVFLERVGPMVALRGSGESNESFDDIVNWLKYGTVVHEPAVQGGE